MNARVALLKARTLLVFAYLLMLAGLVPVLYFVSLVFLPDSARAWLSVAESLLPAPSAPAWITYRVHPGIVYALGGLALMQLGVLLASLQKSAIRFHEERKEDALRRRGDYRRDSAPGDERREPYLGSGGLDPGEDRRVA